MVRYDTSKPEPGTLLVSQEVRDNFTAIGRANELRPVPGSEAGVGDMEVYVELGRYTVTSVATETFPGGSIDLTPDIPVGDNVIVLIYINASGVLTTLAGSEAPIPNPPSYPPDVTPVAEVTLTPTIVKIESSHISDVRPMYVISAAGLGINPKREIFTAIDDLGPGLGQDEFVLTTFQYTIGEAEIMVFADGVYKTTPDDYAENVDGVTITFTNARPAGSKVEVYRVGRANAHFLSDLDDVNVDLSEGIRDPDTNRVAPATRNNPLATLADITGIIPFAVEHDISTGVHGPQVNIVQPGNDAALNINKTGVGIGSAIAIGNAGSSPAIDITQSGTGRAISITGGGAEAINIAQSGNASAIAIVQTGEDIAFDLDFNVLTIPATPAFRISRTTDVTNREPLINLHDSGTATGVNICIYNSQLTFADESTNTPRFTFNAASGQLVLSQGSNTDILVINKASVGAGECIDVTNAGSGDSLLINNIGGSSGAAIRVTNNGTGADMIVNGVTVDNLWTGANADALHTHGWPAVLSDLGDVSADEAAAFNDGNTLRTAPVDINNPFAGLSDIDVRVAKIKFASYTGNGTSQSIAVGFEPDWVMVYNASNSSVSGVYVANGQSGRYFSASGSPSISITVTGFDVVGSATHINNSGDTYVYIAIEGNN